MSDEHESVLLKLTRMEGKLDLSNLRHDQTEARLGTIDNRLNAHGERLAGIENREHERTGERKGVELTGRAIWALVGMAVTIAVALIKFGLGL